MMATRRDQQQQHCRPSLALDLSGQDGNIFAVYAHASRTLREAGYNQEADILSARIFQAEGPHSYGEALTLIGEYVQLTDTSGIVLPPAEPHPMTAQEVRDLLVEAGQSWQQHERFAHLRQQAACAGFRLLFDEADGEVMLKVGAYAHEEVNHV